MSSEAKASVKDETPIEPDWLRSITGLPVCKNGSGGYSDSAVTLFLKDWESEHKGDCERFWVLRFHRKGDSWGTSVSVQEKHRHNGTLYMGDVRTQGDALRLFASLGIATESKASVKHGSD